MYTSAPITTSSVHLVLPLRTESCQCVLKILQSPETEFDNKNILEHICFLFPPKKTRENILDAKQRKY